MPDRTYRILIISSHPVQYSVPLYRLMARHPQVDILVAYCSMRGVQRTIDPGFGVEVQWDIPLLDGYSWIEVPNRSPWPDTQGFWRLINPDLVHLIRSRRFDAVIVYTGYTVASFWITLVAAKVSKSLLFFGTDTHTLVPYDPRAWQRTLKIWFKKLVWPHLFNLADGVIVSGGGVQLMQSLGIPERKIVQTWHTVDNPWWLQQAERVDRAAVRAAWNIPPDDVIVLFCGKIQPLKRPQDALRAFALANVPDSWLVYAGDGPMRKELEQLAHQLNVAERVKFLGFVNQSQLPAVYVASDVLVFPSEYEPFGVVVNEMMLCGHPVVVSDRVGARFDLVRHGETGFIYPCGDIQTLGGLLRELLPDKQKRQQMGQQAREHVQHWSPERNVAALVEAVERASASK